MPPLAMEAIIPVKTEAFLTILQKSWKFYLNVDKNSTFGVRFS